MTYRTDSRTAARSRIAGFAFAAVATLAMLAGTQQLATSQPPAGLLAQMSQPVQTAQPAQPAAAV